MSNGFQSIFRKLVRHRGIRFLLALPVVVCAPVSGAAERASEPEAAVLAVADAALEAISSEDFVAFTDLMIEDAMLYGAGLRDGNEVVIVRNRAGERSQVAPGDILERGFDPTVMVSGSVAMAWYPYDLWVDGEWQHCGVDVFTLVKAGDGWRIASMAFSMEQPPACSMHPDGPPAAVTR